MWLHSVVRTVGAGVIFKVLVVLGVRPKQLQPEDSCAAPNLVRAAGVLPRSTRARLEGAVAGQTLDDTNWVCVAVVVKLRLFNSCQQKKKGIAPTYIGMVGLGGNFYLHCCLRESDCDCSGRWDAQVCTTEACRGAPKDLEDRQGRVDGFAVHCTSL